MRDMRPEVEWFLDAIALARDVGALAMILGEMTSRMGFSHFALTHHVHILDAPHAGIRLHDYPEAWVDYFDTHRLGLSDPIHRASHRTSAGFRWNAVRDLIRMTPADHRLLELAHEHGLADGFTVPANVVGEATGSCSFAIGPGRVLPADALQWAQLAGIAAFEARGVSGSPAPCRPDRGRASPTGNATASSGRRAARPPGKARASSGSAKRRWCAISSRLATDMESRSRHRC